MTLKDLDLKHELALPPWMLVKFQKQVNDDCGWLRSLGIMDYSLLMLVRAACRVRAACVPCAYRVRAVWCAVRAVRAACRVPCVPCACSARAVCVLGIMHTPLCTPCAPTLTSTPCLNPQPDALQGASGP